MYQEHRFTRLLRSKLTTRCQTFVESPTRSITRSLGVEQYLCHFDKLEKIERNSPHYAAWYYHAFVDE